MQLSSKSLFCKQQAWSWGLILSLKCSVLNFNTYNGRVHEVLVSSHHVMHHCQNWTEYYHICVFPVSLITNKNCLSLRSTKHNFKYNADFHLQMAEFNWIYGYWLRMSVLSQIQCAELIIFPLYSIVNSTQDIICYFCTSVFLIP
jgi:hypothetical protein